MRKKGKETSTQGPLPPPLKKKKEGDNEKTLQLAHPSSEENGVERTRNREEREETITALRREGRRACPSTLFLLRRIKGIALQGRGKKKKKKGGRKVLRATFLERKMGVHASRASGRTLGGDPGKSDKGKKERGREREFAPGMSRITCPWTGKERVESRADDERESLQKNPCARGKVTVKKKKEQVTARHTRPRKGGEKKKESMSAPVKFIFFRAEQGKLSEFRWEKKGEKERELPTRLTTHESRKRKKKNNTACSSIGRKEKKKKTFLKKEKKKKGRRKSFN